MEKKKSYYIVFIVFIFILLGVIGYFVFYDKEEAKAPTNEDAVEDISEQSNKTKEVDTSGWLTYENEEYGFSLKYPKEWGELNVKKNKAPEGSKIEELVFLKSSKLNKYVQIQVVKTEDKNDSSVIDYPQIYITENIKYLYYYTSSNDCVGKPDCEEKEIDNNIEKIINTFKIK